VRSRWSNAADTAFHPHLSREPLIVEELAQLLWAAQGITIPRVSHRPSAGALYPLELYAVVGHVVGLPAGLYCYRCIEHALNQNRPISVRSFAGRPSISGRRAAPVTFMMTAVYDRMTGKYGSRGVRYSTWKPACRSKFKPAACLD